MSAHPPRRGMLTELRRRKVFRVAGVYAVVAWALIEVADTVLPRLGVPGWTVTFVIALALLGFPIALVLAWAFDLTPDGVWLTPDDAEAAGTAGPASGGPVLRPAYVRRSTWLVIGLLVVITGASFTLLRPDSPGAGALDPNTVAVLPFRDTGADPSLGYLREGMVDLMAAKLTGEGGPRAVDPRAVIGRWRRATGGTDLPPERARSLARDLGAGLLLQGETVGTPSRMVLNASLLDVASGRTRANATVSGPADSLPMMVDALTLELLARGADEGQHRHSGLTSTSLPALRAYLEGRAATRRGAYEEANQHFSRALHIDSAFALAALGYVISADWTFGGDRSRSIELAWPLRDRLSERDRKTLISYVGPRFPDPSPVAERVEAAQAAVAVAPDRPEAWYYWGDILLHGGWQIGITDALPQAQRALARSLALDSTYASALIHLVELAARDGDTAAVRRLSHIYIGADSAADAAEFVRWRAAVALGDSVALARVRSRFDSLEYRPVLARVFGTALLEGVDLEGADMAAGSLRSQPGVEDRAFLLYLLAGYEYARGRPQAAAEALRAGRIAGAGMDSADRGETWALAAIALEASKPTFRDLLPFGESRLAGGMAKDELRLDNPVMASYRGLSRGDTTGVASALAWLRSDAARAVWSTSAIAVDTAVLRAYLAVLREDPSAAAEVARVDSLSRIGAVPPDANLYLARMFEALDDAERALAAVRRRVYGYLAPWLIATYLREEGRLAALAGDTAGAIRAYDHYLRLRSDPEAAVAPEVEQVRRELARLTGEEAGS